ncbi:sterol desaturase/sphingolipid hydroxylase (fatty acid hydroxylase superfamily) [Zavarzinia compransoris]|uniref:Fatty acid hydroxylase n=2 Tax=Zavarzinia compransoris TaxID=1264899 RepID=A0A317DWZ6_9PROT|nr:fatty acid hydroxylase [Zavarzinia compransoris]TDP48823.1 sterol desaturase/sphingolipid hydroxylase (fatty acid hydroxylase superfamily) [Zavarzinia compransoris]
MESLFQARGAAGGWGAALVLVLILGEAGLARWRGRPAYDLGETAATVVIAAGQRLLAAATAPLLFLILGELYRYRLFAVDMASPLALVALFLGVEFCYYWHHRAMHRFRLLWAVHGVHHSSTRLNLSAAFRLGWGGQATGAALFYAPLVLLGFPPLAVLAMLGANLFYQLFLHASVMPNLGPLEAVLNTPRHHHVHHAVNPVCMDRNFGGALIVFDRLFGTFQALPAEPLRYGTVAGGPSRNPFKAALRGWLDVGRRLAAARGLRAAGAALFGRP